MSHRETSARNNVLHKSSADLKEKHINSVKTKVGGEAEALRISVLWEDHRRAEHKDDR